MTKTEYLQITKYNFLANLKKIRTQEKFKLETKLN